MDNLIFSRSVTSPALLTFLPSISRSTFPSHTPGSCWRSKAGGFEHLSGLLPVGPTAQSQGGVTAHPPRTHLQPGRDATWLHSITWALNYTRCHPIRTVELQTHNVIHYRPLNFKHMTSSTTDQWTTKTHDVNYLTLLPNTKKRFTDHRWTTMVVTTDCLTTNTPSHHWIFQRLCVKWNIKCFNNCCRHFMRCILTIIYYAGLIKLGWTYIRRLHYV